MLAYRLGTIGLLFVLVIIILPAFLNKQGGPARVNEGLNVTGAMNRAQKAYFLENNKFSQKFDELELEIKSETNGYIYKIILQPDSQSVMHIAQAK